jgi:hypothetical protein
MNHHGSPTLNESGLAQAHGSNCMIPPRPADFVEDIQSSDEASRPDGAVALDFGCDVHNGRLMRLWMSPRSGSTTFGGEGREGAWDTDSSGRGAVVVTCTRKGCNNSSRLTNEWLVAHLGEVRTNFESGKGLPIAWFPLSQVKA